VANLGKMFTNFGPVEVDRMIFEGRRATWSKIERIRNTTQISRTFDDCLKQMSERYRYVKR
jgi:TAG lipase/steryl ester hydrolase/phospholipase A2/LPA acyltransferase